MSGALTDESKRQVVNNPCEWALLKIPNQHSNRCCEPTTPNPKGLSLARGNRKWKCGNNTLFLIRFQGFGERRGPFRVNKLGVAQILTR